MGPGTYVTPTGFESTNQIARGEGLHDALLTLPIKPLFLFYSTKKVTHPKTQKQTTEQIHDRPQHKSGLTINSQTNIKR